MADQTPEDVSALAQFVKDALPYVTTLTLSAWGGAVSYLQRIRKERIQFNWRELGFDIVVSTFVGVLTYWVCTWASVDATMSAILISVSGHMGTRAMMQFENLRNRVLGLQDATPEDKPNGTDNP